MDLQVLNDNFHSELLQKVNVDYPAIAKATEVFNKSQSQFMDSLLTVHQLTPLRSARQCLAEIKKVKLAIQEAFFSIRKKEVEIKIKKSQKIKINDSSAVEYLEIEIKELETQIENITENVNGAIRKMSGFMAQYTNILKKYGKDEFTEEDFERDEERYHIMKAFEQGLNAARARGGMLDEGNLIYLYQIGISGTMAQIEVRDFLDSEDNVLKSGNEPQHIDTVRWLESMADKFAGSAQRFADYKGVKLINEQSLLK